LFGWIVRDQNPLTLVGQLDDNLRLAGLLDAAGIDFMLPIALDRLRGRDELSWSVLETMTWAAALLASTRHITIFATVHTTANHPVVAAKQIATMDHIGQGRAGLNIVAGWNEPEYRALGLTLPDDHETRYGYAQEWFDVVEALWTREKPFEWNGRYFHLNAVHSDPKPLFGRPPIVNAAGSGLGRDFAARNADFLFNRYQLLSRRSLGPEVEGFGRRQVR
jgi:alkanesulfonate monooxygenase SsuD/methylene tetrahydromethanopterin reductase-like flavin-dependent oxidoreductase (luciferase family)